LYIYFFPPQTVLWTCCWHCFVSYNQVHTAGVGRTGEPDISSGHSQRDSAQGSDRWNVATDRRLHWRHLHKPFMPH